MQEACVAVKCPRSAYVTGFAKRVLSYTCVQFCNLDEYNFVLYLCAKGHPLVFNTLHIWFRILSVCNKKDVYSFKKLFINCYSVSQNYFNNVHCIDF